MEEITQDDLEVNQKMLAEFPTAKDRLRYRLSTYSGNTLDLKLTLTLDKEVDDWESYLPELNSTFA